MKRETGRVVIVGAGKVGRSLHRAAVRSGVDATLERARSMPRRLDEVVERAPALVVLAVPDASIGSVGLTIGRALEAARVPSSIVHTSGRFGPEALESARGTLVTVGQMHPLVSFVGRTPVDVGGATMLVAGDARAIRSARRFANALRMVPRRFDGLPRPLYHAAAALVANTSAALAEAASELLAAAGVPRRTSAQMIGPLLESVGRNVGAVGLPEALSGPVRRGDAAAVAGHLDALQQTAATRKDLAWIVELYRASVRAQLPMALALGEATKSGLSKIQAVIAPSRKKAPRSALPSRKG